MGFFPNFANEIRKLWGFSEILQMKIENYGVFICKNPIIRNFEKKLWGFSKWKPHNFRFSFAKKKFFDFFSQKIPKIEVIKKHIFSPQNRFYEAVERFSCFWPIFRNKKVDFPRILWGWPPGFFSDSGVVSRDTSKYAT